MKLSTLAAATTTALALAASAPASASVYTDDLSRCLVEKASKADQVYLVKWMFAAMSAGSDVRAMASITQQQRDGYASGAGKLMTRLLTVDCRPEALKALKFDGPSSIEVAFRLLGEVAMKGMMSDPAVRAELEGLAKGADMSALGALFAEAGMGPAPAKPK